MLCPVSTHHGSDNNYHDSDSNFEEITKKLIRGYSEVLGDYIIDGKFDKDHADALTDTIVTYYDTLSKSRSQIERDKIRQLLNMYIL